MSIFPGGEYTIKTTKGTTTYQNLRYGYDNAGNITTITDTINGNQTFVNDDLSRLTQATGAYGTITYNYDKIGNMTYNSQIGNYAYPASGATSIRPHAVTSAGTNSYSYDANGNMTSNAGKTISYDYANRPTSITSGTNTTTFVYDGDGGRVKKIVNGITTVYIGKLYECVSEAALNISLQGVRGSP